MRRLGKTERRLALAMLLVAGLPLATTLFFARALVLRATSVFINADVGSELERSLGVYADLAKAMKDALRAKADAIAAQEPLRAAAIVGHAPSVQEELTTTLGIYPDLYSIRVCKGVAPRDDDDAKAEEILGECAPSAESLGFVKRARPVDAALERTLEVRRPLGRVAGEMGKPPPEMVAVFVAPRARLDDVGRAQEFVKAYESIEKQKDEVQRSYVYGFSLLLVITLTVALFLGSVLARQVTNRIAGLASATQKVGAGDLGVRVPEEGDDEIGDLARAFNRMLSEVEDSRARIEFLRRMGAWQEMARRLAHEIKNPLTPIQLAVEECHRRYAGDDASFRKILDTTQEIVVEEVGTLRRLVTEFSNFARLPRAELAEADFAAFLRDQKDRLRLGEDLEIEGEGITAAGLEGVEVKWEVPEKPLPVGLDPQMFHRVIANLLANAAQAATASGREGHVRVTASADARAVTLDVDDDGPGIPEDMTLSIFDPYVTTKSDGTGLGLAIVKKIVVEHGGTIEAGKSGLGGARLRIRLPAIGTAASEAAMASVGSPSVRGPAAAYSPR